MKEFFDNVSRYPRYLISFTLGILYNAVQPLMPLLQRPTTAIALLGAVIAGFIFLTFTLRAMLGLNVA
jgi:membrane protein insertase Oxa1/YidC/SpoIIIJ